MATRKTTKKTTKVAGSKAKPRAKTPDIVITCPTCGVQPHGLVDGYGVGDRLLEGVMFEVHFEGKKAVAVTTTEARRYMKDLNEKKWLKAVAEHVMDTGEVTCPTCREEIQVFEVDRHEPIVLPALSAADVLKQFVV